MRIGIDAKWYFGGPPSGIRVIQNLVAALVEYDKVNEYYFFLDARYKNSEFPYKNYARVTCIYIWAGNNLLSNVFVLPWKANQLDMDIMLFQNFVSPFYKGKKMVYIFDVLFKSFPQFFTRIERLYFFSIKYLAWFADSIITLSEEEKKRLVKFNFAKESKIEAIYIGVDKSFKPLQNQEKHVIVEVKAKYNLPDRFLLYVGRLNARKNIENLIKALPLIWDKSIPLIVAGKEDWKQVSYKELLKESGIIDRVIFTGWTEEIELPIIYSLATVFCFPSYAEGFGLPPLEAMASGVPVVTSNATSLPEICGQAPLYISPEKPAEIAEAINSLLENNELYQKKVRASIAHASHFTWDKTAANFYKTFLKVNSDE